MKKIIAFMKQWLITHIREYDADYAERIKEHYAQETMIAI